jgi:polysaccharide export outer membrane protein
MGRSDIDLSALARPTPPTEMLHPGDTISVMIATGIEERQPPVHELRVGDNGQVGIPLVGSVPVAGLSLTEAERAIAGAGQARGLYVNPNVTVGIVKPRSLRVTVAGAVNKPATYDLPVANSNLLAALTEAEGLSEDADTIVEIRTPANFHPATDGVRQASHETGNEPPAKTTQVNLTEAARYSRDELTLNDGTVVMVRSREPGKISVLGLVKDPGQFELPDDQDVHLLDAIAMAGGTPLSVADRVLVTRRTEEGSTVTIEASLSEAKTNDVANLLLTEGDVVSVEETATTVALDTVRRFFRIGFSTAIPLF